MNQRRTLRRRGSMLVEVLMAISIGATISAVSVAMIVRLYQVEKTISNTMQTTGSSRRMVDEFRQDAHAAANAELIQNQDEMVTGIQFHTSESQAVTWSFENEQLSRTVHNDDETTHSDEFRLPEATRVIFVLDQAESTPLAILRVHRLSGPVSPAPETESRREYQIVAGLARNHRYESPAVGEGDTP
ncbi:PulJ/GspJ family protein [Thalassoroseus pseudoceratinae]|uniref:PulJ/GspJ family protein n=1 Tax=Thalassoroseus pseudoceratinae TaxID=2713176 RepID=UPI00142215F5|nr:hypothetical protein [Thalassoroseus pseudoceratinae]